MTKKIIKSAVTLALVPEIKTGPWIYWDDLEKSLAHASSLGFDAVELFTESSNALDIDATKLLLEKYKLSIGFLCGVGDEDPLLHVNSFKNNKVIFIIKLYSI